VNAPRRVAGVLFVVLLHLGLLWLLNEARIGQPRHAHATDQRVTVRMVPATRPVLPPATPTKAPNAGITAPGWRPAPRRPQAPTAAAATPPPADLATTSAPSTPIERPIAATPPQAASAAAATGSLLESEATRRAIRASARAPSLTDLAASARQEPAPVAAQERMGQAISRSAKGDCAKGEYLGGGMGILSLPFLAAAAVREQCASR
jgi:hypothetical protein